MAVYRVTELFPANEPLKSQIRESANKVLADLLCNENGSRYIEELRELLGLAESRNWVNSRNFSVLEAEYGKVAEKFKQLKGLPKTRQEKMLGLLRANGKVKLRDLARSFPEVNKRTLLRDLVIFAQTGAIEKNGNGRGAYYVAKRDI